MSDSSVAGQVVNPALEVVGLKKKPGDDAAPAAPPDPPNPADATTGALQDQIQQEVYMRRSGTSTTGGRGVASSPTMSAGQFLVGS